ncbi:hypothetical protein, partial [Bacillus arachidis]
PKFGGGPIPVMEGAGKIPSGGKNLLQDAYQYMKETGEKDIVKEASGAIPKVELKYPLSSKNIKHINKHNIDSIKVQSKYLSDKQLAEKLGDSFFNPKWSKEEINKYSEIAYNDLKSQGKAGDVFEYEIAGEKINVFIHPDGRFGTAYGNHRFTVDEIRKMTK